MCEFTICMNLIVNKITFSIYLTHFSHFVTPFVAGNDRTTFCMYMANDLFYILNYDST